MPIILQFATSFGFQTKLIQFFGRTAYSHVDVVCPNGLLGAQSGKIANCPAGVQIRPHNYQLFKKKLIVTLSATDKQTECFYTGLMAEIGKPYDMEAVFAFMLERDWREPDSWFCSELVATKLEECGWFPYPLTTAVNKLTPDDLLLAISAREKIV